MCIVKIDILNQQRDLKISPSCVRELVELVFLLENCHADEVAIHFVTKRKISLLHQQFFNDPNPTDCITFPIDKEINDVYTYRMIGEVFVCPRVAIEYAIPRDRDPYQETALYVIHGLLHLMGYDDLDEEELKVMRMAERKHLKAMQKRNICLSRLQTRSLPIQKGVSCS